VPGGGANTLVYWTLNLLAWSPWSCMRRLASARAGASSVLRRLMSVHRWPVLWSTHAGVHGPPLCLRLSFYCV